MDTAPFLTLAPGARAPDTCWWIRAADGVRLRAAIWRAEAPVGHVILFTGRTEYLEKAAIPAADWVRRGYTVVSLDWRGQGLSDRAVDPRTKGHVSDFAEFQRDVDALLAQPALSNLPGPGILMAHSMGGAIAAGALARREIAERVRLAVLSAPMIDISLGRIARAAAKATVAIGGVVGRLDRWPPFGDMSTTYVLTDPSPNVLTQDEEVWAWMAETARQHPDLALAMPTLAWFRASFAEIARLRTLEGPQCPALCVIGSEEQVVDPEAVGQWATRTGTQLETIAKGRHELLIEAPEIRTAAWGAIDDFLARNEMTVRPASDA